MRWKQTGAFALISLVWGSEWLATRVIVMPPLLAQGIRYALAALLLGGTVAWLGTRSAPPRKLMVVAATGVTMLALPVLFTSWAEIRISPGLLVVILSMTPLLTALIEGLATGTLLTWLVAGIGGTALLASQGLSFAVAQWAGALATFLAATSIAGSVVVLKRRCATVHPLWIATIQFASASLCVLLVSSLVERGLPLTLTRKALGLELVLAVAANAVAFPIYYWLLGETESFKMTSTQWLVTVVSVAESLFFLRSLPSWRTSSGITLILVSSWLSWRSLSGDDAPVTLEMPDEVVSG